MGMISRFIKPVCLCYKFGMMNSKFFLFLLSVVFLVLLTHCDRGEPSKDVVTSVSSQVSTPAQQVAVGCAGCHDQIKLDPNHELACVSCHGGVDETSDKVAAHNGLITQPAHPDNMEAACGSCHGMQIKDAEHALHFTLKNKVNQIRAHFGRDTELANLTQVPEHESLDSLQALSDDMLRRRCLRCHLYSAGDDYPYVARGTGCAACHLSFESAKMLSHGFQKPTQRQCQSCHYGNYVGSDYIGRFENDHNWEYRTPYVTSEPFFRPYGIEHLNLATDIHQQKGLVCTDCHGAVGHNETKPTCMSCHEWQPGTPLPQGLVVEADGTTLTLTGKASGKKHPIPQLKHPAHKQYIKQVSCQVCHAQWAVNDGTVSLLLSSSDDLNQWERLTVQGSSYVEQVLEHNLYSFDEELPLAMPDGITGLPKEGIWYKGYSQRRWEDLLLCKDAQGIIQVCRPILDLRLSMLSDTGQVMFDNSRGIDTGLRPYAPHTVGAAGLFYLDRFAHLLSPEPTAPTN